MGDFPETWIVHSQNTQLPRHSVQYLLQMAQSTIKVLENSLTKN